MSNEVQSQDRQAEDRQAQDRQAQDRQAQDRQAQDRQAGTAPSGGLRSIVESIKARDPAARSLAEVALLYPGLRVLAFHRLAHALWTGGFLFLARFVSELGRWFSGIEIHPGAVIGQRLFIDHGTGVVIGETAVIGNDVTLYHGVTLGGIAPGSRPQGRRHPVVEDDVIIGAGAQVLGGITIGKGARVGANAVVVRDVSPGVTVVGIPAQVVVARPAAKPDFLPYGSPCDDLPDPTSRALCGLLNEVEALRRRVAELETGQAESRGQEANPKWHAGPAGERPAS